MSSLDPIHIFWHDQDVDFDFPQKISSEEIISKIFNDHNSTADTINIIFCTDEYLLQINKQHLNHDYFTDIITFCIDDDPISGDLYISVDRVKENAVSHDAEFLHEMQRVIIHGILHLVGHSDHTEKEKLRMRQKENEYLAISDL